MGIGLVRGMIAGAAGTTALNAATYADMAVRGRPSSSSPQDLVEKGAGRAGVPIPGGGEQRQNRLNGLGSLSGTVVGTTVGAAAGAVHSFLARHGRRVPPAVAVAIIAAAAMALSDVPLAVLGVSHPTDWSSKDWAADALPHLAFGAVTYAALHVGDVS